MRVLLFLLALCATSPALAQSRLQRVPSPDGGISVLTECNEAELKRTGSKESFRIECTKSGIRYVVFSGEKYNGRVLSYDQEMAESRARFGAQQIKQIRVDGYQGFQILCGNGEQICLQVINFRPGLPLIMGAYKVDKSAAWPTDLLIEISTAFFYRSLRIKG